MKTIEELRKEGFKVFVEHRRYDCRDNVLPKRLRRPYPAIDFRLLGQQDFIWPKGGATFVHLRSPDGRVVTGYTACSWKDNFNKRRGMEIALNRALAILEGKSQAKETPNHDQGGNTAA